MVFEHDYEIKVSDINKDLYLKNKALMAFLEDVGNLQSATIGYGIQNILQTKASWILLNWKVKVYKRPKYGTILSIKTWCRGANKLHCYRDYEVYDKQKEEILICATSKWTIVNPVTGKLVIVPSIIPENYEVNDRFSINQDEPKKILEPKESILTNIYQVKRSNIDFNNHTHNLDYLDIAYEAIPEEGFNNGIFDDIEIMYKKETKLNDNLKCFYSYEGSKHTVIIKSEDEKLTYAIVQMS